MGTAIAAIVMVLLLIPGYLLGSWRWIRRDRGLWEVWGGMAFFLISWYGLLHLVGGPQSLVPVAILVLVVGHAAGRVHHMRRVQATQRPSR
ncbi:MAG TPA: hypothetical protein VGO03_13455 [Acidimicrobiia bacterium]